MTNANAIAQHLNIIESAILRIEEWAKVLFVVVKGIGARFVSKKVLKMNLTKEQFAKACDYKFTVPGPAGSPVTDAMIKAVGLITADEAKRLLSLPGSAWDNESKIGEIESTLGRCRDRHIAAVLEVASKVNA